VVVNGIDPNDVPRPLPVSVDLVIEVASMKPPIVKSASPI
jgi:hypothetical protein